MINGLKGSQVKASMLLIVLVGLGSALVYFFSIRAPINSRENNDSLSDKSYAINIETAKTEFDQGNVSNAESYYTLALSQAVTAQERASALYGLAMVNLQSRPREAINNFKQIIVDEQLSSLQRAYAVQRMALIYYRTGDQSLLAEMFTGTPYVQLYVPNDPQLSVRNLFEYGINFYPLAVSTMRAAMWYTDQLRIAHETLDHEKFSTLKSEYLPVIDRYLTYAKQDIERSKEIENQREFIPEAYYVMALNEARLAAIGLPYEYESTMSSALEASEQFTDIGVEGSIRYTYALNLVMYEEGRVEDARQLLMPMITDIDKYYSIKNLLIREKSNKLSQKKNIFLLAETFPEFKNLLISLGWVEQDFQS